MMEFARWALAFHPTSGVHQYMLCNSDKFLRDDWANGMKDWDWESVIIDYYTWLIAGGYESANTYWIDTIKKRATP